MFVPELNARRGETDANSRLLVLALCLVAGFAGYFLKPAPVAPPAPVAAPVAPAPYVPPVCPGGSCPIRNRPFGVTCFFCRRGLVVTPPGLGQAVGASVGLASEVTKAATKSR